MERGYRGRVPGRQCPLSSPAPRLKARSGSEARNLPRARHDECRVLEVQVWGPDESGRLPGRRPRRPMGRSRIRRGQRHHAGPFVSAAARE